jgi:hypothetical protein
MSSLEYSYIPTTNRKKSSDINNTPTDKASAFIKSLETTQPTPEGSNHPLKHNTIVAKTPTPTPTQTQTPTPMNNIRQATDEEDGSGLADYVPIASESEMLSTGLTQEKDYYDKKNRLYSEYSTTPENNASDISQDVLMTKLNYIVTLLEEQQDHKKEGVVDELILYILLGIFVILIVDCFSNTNSYRREI